MELTKEQIEILRNDKKGGFTEERIVLLMHDKAPQKVKYAAEKILKAHWEKKTRQALEEKKRLAAPLPRGEYEYFTRRVAASINPTIKNVDTIAGILSAKGLITNDERTAFVAEDKCASCASVRPLVGGYCPEVLTKGGGKAITSHDVWPSVEYSLVDKVLQCSLYEKKG